MDEKKILENLVNDFDALDKYVNEMDTVVCDLNDKLASMELRLNTTTAMLVEAMDRILVIEREFDIMNRLEKRLTRFEKELGLDDRKPYTMAELKGKGLNGGKDFLGDGGEQ